MNEPSAGDDSTRSGPYTDRTARIVMAVFLLFIVSAIIISQVDFKDGHRQDSQPRDVSRIEHSPPPDPEVYKLLEGSAAGEIRDDNGLAMKLVWCPPGEFEMGSPVGTGEEDEHGADGAPVRVVLTHGFWLGRCEVTRREWLAVMHTTPWWSSNEKALSDDEAGFAATDVDQHDAVEFCRRLTKTESSAGRLPKGWTYSLPTEAQWEYACRAGTNSRYSFGDDGAELAKYAWWGFFNDETGSWTDSPVHCGGELLPNAWGLVDMHGNASEWCRDQYVKHLPGGTNPEVVRGEFANRSDPMAIFDDTRVGQNFWVFRGGGYNTKSARDCRCASRFRYFHDLAGVDAGLRVALCPRKRVD